MTTTFLITGGYSGLGKAISLELEDYDTYVYILDQEDGYDVTDRSSIQKFFKDFIGEQKIDCLINCAGIAHLDWFPSITTEQYQKVMDVNALSLMLMVQEALPHLTGHGVVCNVLSTAAKVPMTNSFAYNASKGAAAMMTRQMARELIKTHGITVFGISPNKLKDTKMTEMIDANVTSLRDWTPEQAVQYQANGNGNLEYTDPAAIAEVLAFILMEKHRHKFLNGAILEMGV